MLDEERAGFYVLRHRGLGRGATSGRWGWTGPIARERDAVREGQAWLGEGYDYFLYHGTVAVVAEVDAWTADRHRRFVAGDRYRPNTAALRGSAVIR